MTVFRMPGEIPLPQPADYELAIATTVEAEQIYSGQDVLPVFHGHMSVNPQYGEYINAASLVGAAIEPYDRSTEQLIDPRQKIAHAVVRGMVFGRLFVPRAHDVSVDLGTLVPVFPMAINHIQDRMERNHALGSFFVKTGEQGAEEMGDEACRRLDELSSVDALLDLTDKRFFVVGCGVVAYSALYAHERSNNNAALNSLQKGEFTADWDGELTKLLE